MQFYLLGALFGAAIVWNYSKIKNIYKLTNVVCSTLAQRYTKKDVLEHEYINGAYVLKQGNVVMNTRKVAHRYELFCFTSETEKLHQERTHHSYSPFKDVKNDVKLTFFTNGNYIVSIPFRPSDFNYKRLFVAIKHTNEDLYSVYRFDDTEYINLLDLTERYENDLASKKTRAVVLAEAFD